MPEITNLPIFFKLAFAAVIVATPPAVLADDEEPGGEDSRAALFERLDANADGKLTSDEIPEDRQRW